MGNRYLVIFGILVLAALGWYFTKDSTEEEIRNFLVEIETLVETDPLPNQALEQAKFGSQIAKLVTKDFVFVQGEQNKFSLANSPETVRRYATLAPRYVSSIEANLKDLVFLEVSPELVKTEVLLYYKADLRKGGTLEDEALGYVYFTKSDGDWKISRIESPQVFR